MVYAMFDIKKALEADAKALEGHSAGLASIAGILGTIAGRLESETLAYTPKGEALLSKMIELRELIERTKTDMITHGKALSSETEVLHPVLNRLTFMEKKSSKLGQTCWFPFWQHRCDAKVLDTLDKGLSTVLPQLQHYSSMLKSSSPPQTATIPMIPVLPPTPATEPRAISPSLRSISVGTGDLNGVRRVERAPVIDRVPTATLSAPAIDSGTASLSSKQTSLCSHTPDILPPMSDEDAMNRLPQLDAGYRAVKNKNKCKYVPGTRKRILEELESWAFGVATEPVSVLYGMAGTGKSTIAAELAQRIQHRGQLGASFFFVRGQEDYTTLMFPTVAVQLARLQPSLCNPIVEGIRSHLAAGQHQQMKFQVEDLFGPLKRTPSSPSHAPVVIVIDGVDECLPEAEGLPDLIKSLASLTEVPTCPVRLLITSRPDMAVEDTVRELQVSTRVLWIHGGEFDDKDDIKLYLRHGLSPIMPDGPAREEVISRLAVQSEGSFAYAGTVMEHLQSRSHSSHLSERLRTVLTPASNSALERMDDLFLTALRTAFPPTRSMQTDHSDKIHLRRVLGLITVLEQLTSPSPASSPSSSPPHLVRGVVSPRMLALLLGPELAHEDTTLVLNRLRSIIHFDRDQPEAGFSPIHTSLRTFLSDPNRCTEPLYQIDAKTEHTRLAMRCLRFLNTSLTRHLLLEVFERPRKADAFVVERRLRENIPLALQYACAYWAPHVIAGNLDDHLPQELGSFVRSKISEWIEMLGYMGGLALAAPALQQVILLSGGLLDINVRATLEDSIRLLQENLTRLEECPSDVYTLRPLGPASPRASIVSSFYSESTPSPTTPSPITPRGPTTSDFVQWQNGLPSPTANGSTATVIVISPTIAEDHGAPPLGPEQVIEDGLHRETPQANDRARPTEGGPSKQSPSDVKDSAKATRSSSLESTKPSIPANGAHPHLQEYVARAQTYGDQLHPVTIQTRGSKSSIGNGSSTHSTSSYPADYLSVLKGAFPGKPGDKLPPNTKRVLGGIALLTGSLSPIALAELTKVPIGDVTSVLDALPSVLRYDPANLAVKVDVLDENFARFLVSRENRKHTRFMVDVRTQHTYLATRCLEVLSKALTRNPCQLADPTATRTSISDIEAHLDVSVDEHVRYACVQWVAHLANSDPGNGALSDALLAFVSGEHAFRWLELLAWMGQLGVATAMLSRVDDWFKENAAAQHIVQDRRAVKGPTSVDARSVLKQIRDYVIMNYHAIEACPSSVY